MEYKICKKCGKNTPRDYCIHCGFNNVENNEVEANDKSDNNNDISNKNSKTSVSAIVFLFLSIINLVLIAPFAIKFSAIWLLFGAFASKSDYYRVLYTCYSYGLSSVVAVIVFIINLVKNGKFFSNSIIIILLSFFIFFVGLHFVLS